MSKISELAKLSKGVKIDFGNGTDDLLEGFTGFDIYDHKKTGKILEGDLSKPRDKTLLKLKDTVSFALCRHTVCCLPRNKIPLALRHIYNSLIKDGYFLISDFDLELFMEKLLAWNPVQEVYESEEIWESIKKEFGLYFSDWMKWAFGKISEESGEKGLRFSASIFLNIALRGINFGGRQEISWRLSRKEFEGLLIDAGFSSVVYIPLEGPLADEFTHTRPLEDMVFLCKK